MFPGARLVIVIGSAIFFVFEMFVQTLPGDAEQLSGNGLVVLGSSHRFFYEEGSRFLESWKLQTELNRTLQG